MTESGFEFDLDQGSMLISLNLLFLSMFGYGVYRIYNSTRSMRLMRLMRLMEFADKWNYNPEMIRVQYYLRPEYAGMDHYIDGQLETISRTTLKEATSQYTTCISSDTGALRQSLELTMAFYGRIYTYISNGLIDNAKAKGMFYSWLQKMFSQDQIVNWMKWKRRNGAYNEVFLLYDTWSK